MLKALPREDFANNVTLLFPTPDIWSDTLYHLNQSQRAGLQAFPPEVADAFLPYLMPGTYATVRCEELGASSQQHCRHEWEGACRCIGMLVTPAFGHELQWGCTPAHEMHTLEVQGSSCR